MIVLTGAAGFIGSCILAALNSAGHNDIMTVDHLDDDLKEENLKNKKFSQYLDKKEFIELVGLDKLPPSVDFVIHMGACSSTILQDAAYFEENNFQYSRKLAEWCLARKAKMIYASSAATYGDGAQGYHDDDASTRRCKPLNLYGKSKQKFDEWVLDHDAIDTLTGLKFFNVFGPNEYHKGEMRSLVAKAHERVVREGKMGLFKSYKKEYADGEQKRDFIYVKDAVDVVMYFFKNPSIGGIYNVGTGKARSWNDLAHALFKAVGKKPIIEYINMPEYMRAQYQYFTQADMNKLRASGYGKSFMELEDAVADYARYLSRHAYI